MKVLGLTIHYRSETKNKEVDQDDVLLDVIKTLFLSQDMTYEKFTNVFVLRDIEGVVDPRNRMKDCRSLVLELVEREKDLNNTKKVKTIDIQEESLRILNAGKSTKGVLNEDCKQNENAKCTTNVQERNQKETSNEYADNVYSPSICKRKTETKSVASSAYENSNIRGVKVSPSQEIFLDYDMSTPLNGLCGLSNIGNTCFMNTAIQCLSNLPLFTSFFLTKEYSRWINTRNKLGYKGEMARLWYGLVNDLFSEKKVIKAYNFKSALGKLTNKFVDFEEQDTAEFVNMVLDCLHEDLKMSVDVFEKVSGMFNFKIDFERLNCSDDTLKKCANVAGFGGGECTENHTGEDVKVCNKKSAASTLFEGDRVSNSNGHLEDIVRTEDKESTGTPRLYSNSTITTGNTNGSKALRKEIDKVLQEYFSFNDKNQYDLDWYSYLKGNTSIVSLLFSGKLLSTLECLNCNLISKKYELFTSLTLNIPERKSSVFLIFDSDFKLPICIPVDISWCVGELKKIIKYEYQIQRDMVVVSIKNGSVEKVYSDHERLVEGLCCYEYDTEDEYCWLRIRAANYLILNSYLDFMFLVRYKDNVPYNYGRVIKKLKPLMQKDIDLDYHEWSKIFDLVLAHRQPGNKANTFPVMTMVLKLSAFQELFGKNFSMRSYLNHDRELTLDDCIQSFESKEYLLGNNNAYCAKCESNQDHSKEFVIYKTPKYLILHFKRLSYEFGYCNKINTYVDFKENCVIKGEQYHLLGICNHIEIAMSSGHYTATVKKNGVWYCFNDACITKVDNLVKENAYMLFYAKA